METLAFAARPGLRTCPDSCGMLKFASGPVLRTRAGTSRYPGGSPDIYTRPCMLGIGGRAQEVLASIGGGGRDSDAGGGRTPTRTWRARSRSWRKTVSGRSSPHPLQLVGGQPPASTIHQRAGWAPRFAGTCGWGAPCPEPPGALRTCLPETGPQVARVSRVLRVDRVASRSLGRCSYQALRAPARAWHM